MSIDTIITTLLTQLSKISPPHPLSENDSLQQHQQNHSRNDIFTNLSPADTIQLKNLLLTLHCLFPNELLLALDILDRGFVMRYTYHDNNNLNNNIDNDNDDTLISIVQSTSNHDRDAGGGGKVYHVHLKTWNCSCPAFVMNCFPPSTSDDINGDSDMIDDVIGGQDFEEDAWFGGTIRNRESSYDDRSVPICKHMLACVLVAKCPNLFGRKCLTYEVNNTDRANEVAGWCAA
ncbi:hypothetical protein EYB26_006936 [Talaromyces marneffei]|uniref:uncharacterized protein n=1 Tax=Talaromyces marneffei TaxID=37727 RepID=UPI0012A85479|nr:uncharacterized protein EYB26_006936 [Talaromyces marneffei]QGA19248.1 hypothetical protein EYB26_006936 [Talaromyces marneffei]